MQCRLLSRWISRCFKRWRYSHKVAKYKSPLKFTPQNIQRYVNHIIGIQSLPILQLKFLDECHFDSKDCLRKKGVGPRGRAMNAVLPFDAGVRYSVTLLTSLDQANGTVVSTPRTDSNDALDFLDFLIDLMKRGYLRAGDILVSHARLC